ncbi:MAG: radical SAM family heme chaperone HemW, partial [Oscillospiraceae bacterium]|nr:radical SAM family heme chaperone HemW [Oscillospiraceae bacterium]
MRGVYIHLPFCQTKCDYCDFYSITNWNGTLLREYRECVRDEIRLASNKYGKFDISTVYLGGGTPSVFPAEHIDAMLETLRETFNLAAEAEITIEANPGTVDYDRLLAYRKSGINRISIGIQAAQDGLLASIGRRHRFADAVNAVETAKKAGFNNISLDMMLALPNQSIEDALETAQRLCELEPTHISAYELTLAEDTPFAKRFASAPCPEDYSIKMMEEVYARLASHGFRRYEISNWCKPGFESKHNIGYWTRRDYLGIGAGAHSLMRGERFRNADNVGAWMESISRGKLYHSDTETIDEREAAFERLMLGLRMTGGVVCSDETDKYFAEQIRSIIEDGLAERAQGKLRLTE